MKSATLIQTQWSLLLPLLTTSVFVTYDISFSFIDEYRLHCISQGGTVGGRQCFYSTLGFPRHLYDQLSYCLEQLHSDSSSTIHADFRHEVSNAHSLDDFILFDGNKTTNTE